MVNATDLRLEKSGLEEAKKIIFRKEMKKNTSPSKKKKKTTMYKLIDLNLSETERSDFRAFWNQHKHSAYMDKAVLSAYWLSKHKEINDFTADHFFTLLRTINENASFDIAGALKNSKQLKNHFIYDIDSNSYKLHHIGEDYVKSLENKELGSNE